MTSGMAEARECVLALLLNRPAGTAADRLLAGVGALRRRPGTVGTVGNAEWTGERHGR